MKKKRLFMNKSLFLISSFLFFSSSAAQSAGGMGVKFVNYYALFLEQVLGIHDHHLVHDFTAVLGSIFGLFLLLLGGIFYRKKVMSEASHEPSEQFNWVVFVDSLLSFIYGLGVDVMGKVNGPRFFGLLSSLFLFIFVCNLTGLVPGFPPATENIGTNLALGLSVFAVYNYAGIREHGLSYVKQFMGPVWWMVPLFLIIETVSHIARPLSLSLRLFGNIMGDHLVLSIFTGLTYLILPAFLLFFGLLVASIQSFVFTLLTSIYISLAVSHDH